MSENQLGMNEQECVSELRKWVEAEAEFYGRTDEDFLLMFLRGCKFNMEKTKKKMSMFYLNRKRFPQWWTNRSVDEMSPVTDNLISTPLADEDTHLATLAVTQLARVSRSSSLLDMYIKQHSLLGEICMRRENSQVNGVVWVVDCLDYPSWLFIKLLNPTLIYNIVHSFYMATPIRIKGIHVINFPAVARAVWYLLKSMLPVKIRKRVHLYGSDWSSLSEHIDQRQLPVEYGGSNGSFDDHQAAFKMEMSSRAGYYLDDEKYGF